VKFSYLLAALLIVSNCGSGSKDKDTLEQNKWYKPTPNTTWHWQLQGDINQDYNVSLYDIDLFDSSKELISSLKKSGKRVICYFSAGTYENWREDSSKYPDSVLGEKLDNWEGERWLDIREIDILMPIIKARLKLAKDKGFDGVEPDNVDGYANSSGFDLSYKEQIRFNKLIAKEAHNLNLAVALKNDLAQIKELEPFFDFAINEQCHKYNECDKLKPFINNNKAVLNAEYDAIYIEDKTEQKELCKSSKVMNIRTLILPIELDDSFRYSCN